MLRSTLGLSLVLSACTVVVNTGKDDTASYPTDGTSPSGDDDDFTVADSASTTSWTRGGSYTVVDDTSWWTDTGRTPGGTYFGGSFGGSFTPTQGGTSATSTGGSWGGSWAGGSYPDTTTTSTGGSWGGSFGGSFWSYFDTGI